MRVVVDTNVIVSGLYDLDSIPGRILAAAASENILLCAPWEVRDELVRVLQRVLGYSAGEVAAALSSVPVEWIERPVYEAQLPRALGLIRDESDAPVLALALAIRCDIVSGDRDLQAVKVRGISIWKPAELGAP